MQLKWSGKWKRCCSKLRATKWRSAHATIMRWAAVTLKNKSKAWPTIHCIGSIKMCEKRRRWGLTHVRSHSVDGSLPIFTGHLPLGGIRLERECLFKCLLLRTWIWWSHWTLTASNLRNEYLQSTFYMSTLVVIQRPVCACAWATSERERFVDWARARDIEDRSPFIICVFVFIKRLRKAPHDRSTKKRKISTAYSCCFRCLCFACWPHRRIHATAWCC